MQFFATSVLFACCQAQAGLGELRVKLTSQNKSLKVQHSRLRFTGRPSNYSTRQTHISDAGPAGFVYQVLLAAGLMFLWLIQSVALEEQNYFLTTEGRDIYKWPLLVGQNYPWPWDEKIWWIVSVNLCRVMRRTEVWCIKILLFTPYIPDFHNW